APDTQGPLRHGRTRSQEVADSGGQGESDGVGVQGLHAGGHEVDQSPRPDCTRRPRWGAARARRGNVPADPQRPAGCDPWRSALHDFPKPAKTAADGRCIPRRSAAGTKTAGGKVAGTELDTRESLGSAACTTKCPVGFPASASLRDVGNAAYRCSAVI